MAETRTDSASSAARHPLHCGAVRDERPREPGGSLAARSGRDWIARPHRDPQLLTIPLWTVQTRLRKLIAESQRSDVLAGLGDCASIAVTDPDYGLGVEEVSREKVGDDDAIHAIRILCILAGVTDLNKKLDSGAPRRMRPGDKLVSKGINHHLQGLVTRRERPSGPSLHDSHGLTNVISVTSGLGRIRHHDDWPIADGDVVHADAKSAITLARTDDMQSFVSPRIYSRVALAWSK